MLETGIFYGGENPIDVLVSLKGTSYFTLENMTINGGFKSKWGLFCGRNETSVPAGKHTFSNLRVVECLESSYVNYASEESIHTKCQFQRSPIGAVFTAYPIVNLLSGTSVDFDASYTSSIAHHLYDCAMGSEAFTSRCGLMVFGSMVNMYGGVIQSEPNAEAGVIIDSTRRQCTFRDVYLDGNLSKIGYKIGHYTQNRTGYEWANRVIISGHITIHPGSGTAYISAYNLRNSIIESVSFNGPPDLDTGIDLLGGVCRGNTFLACMHDDQRPVKINMGTGVERNLSLLDGEISWIDSSSVMSIRSDPSLPGRLLFNSGIYLLLQEGIYPLTFRRSLDPQPKVLINSDGVLAWGGW